MPTRNPKSSYRPAGEELRLAIANKTDEELYDILYAHPGDYTADTIELAREEFRRRELDEDRVNKVRAAAESQLEQEKVPLSWSLKTFAFFFSTLLFGIPVMLAHRRFTEQGAKRKAREFGRWALYGFGFYLALFVVKLIAAA